MDQVSYLLTAARQHFVAQILTFVNQHTVEDELVKVVRIRKSNGVIASDEDFTQQIISGVRFASLLTFPITEIVIPAKVWEPATHRFYPDSFRAASKELILCCYADYKQPLPQKVLPQCGFNLAATLPKAIWMEILSFTHRDCKSLQAGK